MPKELRVGMADRPGSLATLAEALGRANVNMLSIAAIPSGGRGDIRILVEDPMAARKALAGAGLEVQGEREVLLVDLDDRPGSLGKTARQLADAGLNIDAIYVVGQSGGKKQVALGVADVAEGRKALGL